MRKNNSTISSKNHKKIKEVCQIMIDDLRNSIAKGGDIENEIKLWKTGDSALEILTKLVAVLAKLEGHDEEEKAPQTSTRTITKADYIAISEFVKNYDTDNKRS